MLGTEQAGNISQYV